LNSLVSQIGSWSARHKVRLSLAGAGAAVLLIIGWNWLPGTESDAAAKRNAPQAIAVEAALANRADVPVNLEGLGTVQAYNSVNVTTRVDGELQKLGFVEGQAVHKGELLAQIDPRPYQATVGQAEAARAKDQALLESARQDLERYKTLAPQNLTSQQTLDAQKATVAGLEAQIKGDEATLANARTQLAYTSITSPIDGRTGIRKVDVGNNLHASDTSGIVVVTQVQPISMIFTLPEGSLTEINEAMRSGPVQVAAISQDGTTELDRGTVALVDNQIDQTTGTIRLKANFPNARNTLWPGQFVNARVLVRTEHSALTIPSAALQRGPNGMFAYVVKPDSTVEARPLKVGEDRSGVTVVQGGVREGERVVTTNQYRLEPGAHVRIVAEPGTEVAAAGRHTGQGTQ
jgi:multidrug efflux system membrane fusion protein